MTDDVTKFQARIQLELNRAAASPAYYIFNHVRTVDPQDFDHPLKQFPRKAYLEYLVDKVLTHGQRVEYIIKSRQVMMSWVLVAYISWLSRFWPMRYTFIQSKKDKDALELLYMKDPHRGRLNLIERNLPKWMRHKFVGSREGGKIGWIEGEINFADNCGNYPNGSVVEAIPQGPSQIESRVPTLYFNDESSLQDQWAASIAAANPAIQKQSRMICVATSRPPCDYNDEMGWSQELDEDGSNLPCKQVWEQQLTGIYKYRSKSGVSAHGVHYSCDPDKDPDTPQGLAWRDDLASTYPGGIDGFMWRQHMEIDFEAVSGEALFPDWDIQTRHAIVDVMPRELQANWQYYSGFDYGKRNLCCWYIIALYTDGDGDLIRRVMLGVEGTGDALGAVPGISLAMKVNPHFEHVNGRIHSDPSLWNKNQSVSGGYRSLAQLFAEEGVHLVPAKAKGQEADDILIERLKYNYWSDGDKPLFLVERNCIQMLRQFKGLRYKEWTPATKELHSLQEVLVDRANDSWDSIKYAECSRPSPHTRKLPPPPGSFMAARDAIIRKNRRQTLRYGNRYSR